MFNGLSNIPLPWLQWCSCHPNPLPACFCATPPLLLFCVTETSSAIPADFQRFIPRAATRAGSSWSLLARPNHLQTGAVHNGRNNKILDHSTDSVYPCALSSFLTSVTHLPWIKRLYNPRDWKSADIRNVLLVFETLCCNYINTKGLQRVLCTILNWPSLYSSPAPCVNTVYLRVLGGAGSPSQTVLLTQGYKEYSCSAHVLQL